MGPCGGPGSGSSLTARGSPGRSGTRSGCGRSAGGSCNRLVAVLRRAYSLGKEKFELTTGLTFPHFAPGKRGEYITEDQYRAICANFQARFGAQVKADVFRLAYLTGIRKGRLRNARKRHVLIVGEPGSCGGPRKRPRASGTRTRWCWSARSSRSSSARGRTASPTATSCST